MESNTFIGRRIHAHPIKPVTPPIVLYCLGQLKAQGEEGTSQRQYMMDSLQVTIDSLQGFLFCFQTRDANVKNFCTYKIEFETLAKEFSRKRKGILIHSQSHFKLQSLLSKKNLKLLNLRVWCMDK